MSPEPAYLFSDISPLPRVSGSRVRISQHEDPNRVTRGGGSHWTACGHIKEFTMVTVDAGPDLCARLAGSSAQRAVVRVAHRLARPWRAAKVHRFMAFPLPAGRIDAAVD
jgi:hypothetical protein